MASKFQALDLGLIDEGRFMETVNNDLREAQADLVEFVRKHGPRAEGAKAKLTVEIQLTCDSADDQLYSIKAQTKKTVPSRPACVTMAMAEEGEDDKPALFVRNSGSSRATPKQGVLTTEDGRVVDTETGEVKGKAPGK